MNKLMFLVQDGFNNFNQNIDEQTGFLHLNGVVARTGIQEYYGLELALDDLEPMKKYKVARLPEDVLKKESLDSYINSTVTDNHPTEFVTVDNIKDLNRGSVATIETFNEDGIDYIKTDIVINDKVLIKKVVDGKVEISAGYSQVLVPEKGEFNGQSYDFKQTEIKINHVAIVDKGRCGGKCKLVTDSYDTIINVNEFKRKEESMKVIKIGDTEIEVCDTVAGHISSLETKVKSHDAEMEKMEKDLEEEKKKKDMGEEDPKKSNEPAKAEDAKLFDAKVSEKVDLMARASKVGAVVKATDSIEDMRIAIEDAVIKMTDALDEKKKVLDSQKSAFDGHGDKKDVSNFASLQDKEI